MKSMINKVGLSVTLIFTIANAVYAVPEVTNLKMTQREGTRIVEVTYDLENEAAIVTLSIETNGVAIPDSMVTRLTGDVCKVILPGPDKSIVWNAGADWPEHDVTNARAQVTAWFTNTPPLYCAVDVTGGTAAATTYPVYYYASAEAVPGGVTNRIYKTFRILMRKISPTGAEGFMMGSPLNELRRVGDREDCHNVVLSKAFYAGVYQVTQSQWQQVMGDLPSSFANNDYRLTRPVEKVSYNTIRGSSAGSGWPANSNVDPDSFMGRLRRKSSLADFDLPTDAQWEYACRAGTTGAFNDGTVNFSLGDPQLDLLGRHGSNGGKINGTVIPDLGCTTENGTAAVGSYVSNEWGLYDMHGNVWEWCLDMYVPGLGTSPVSDPKGAVSGSTRVRRGGCWNTGMETSRSACRSNFAPSDNTYDIGFRLVRILP